MLAQRLDILSIAASHDVVAVKSVAQHVLRSGQEAIERLFREVVGQVSIAVNQ